MVGAVLVLFSTLEWIKGSLENGSLLIVGEPHSFFLGFGRRGSAFVLLQGLFVIEESKIILLVKSAVLFLSGLVVSNGNILQIVFLILNFISIFDICVEF